VFGIAVIFEVLLTGGRPDVRDGRRFFALVNPGLEPRGGFWRKRFPK